VIGAKDRRAVAVADAEVGDVFNYANVQATVRSCRARKRILATPMPRCPTAPIRTPRPSWSDWTFHVQRGKKVYFGQVIMQGGGNTRDKVIRREMILNEGELYSEDKIQISQGPHPALGLF
jgi:outer membrane protein insertion porin family